MRVTDRFILATSSHRMGGGGGFPCRPPAARLRCRRHGLRDILVPGGAPADPREQEPARLVFRPGMLRTSVVLDTAEAVSDRDDLVSLGPAAGGFQRFRLHL